MDTALQALIKERDKLEKELAEITDRYAAQIHDLDNSIQILSGKKHKNVAPAERYDDENPDYIRNNEDGL